MSAKYLLPCHDGKTVEVTTADAGRTVVCPCGKKVQVPTLRGVQSLTRAEQVDTRPAAPAWSARQGAMFTTGLCMLLVGGIALAMLYNNWRQINTEKPDMDAQLLANVKLAVENAEPANTLDGWYALRNSPLPDDRGMQWWEANRAVAQKYMIYMSVAGAVAAIGLGLTIGGPLLKPAPVKRPSPRPAPAR